MKMLVRHLPTFDKFTAEDLGLRAGDTDAHCPSFYIIRKSQDLTHKDLHQRSAAGKDRDAKRRKQKRTEKKRTQRGKASAP